MRTGRWFVVGAIGALAAAACVGSRGAGERPQTATAETATAETATTQTVPAQTVAAPEVVSRSAVLASWGSIHVGYAFVYADGRFLWYPDGGVLVTADGSILYPPSPSPYSEPRDSVLRYAVLERRLSPLGVELVRAGTLTPHDFMRDMDLHLREELWAAPTLRAWEPSEYAICPFSDGQLPGTTRVIESLSTAVQKLLLGKERTFNPNTGTASWSSTPFPLMECFELTTAETSKLRDLLDANRSDDEDPPGLLGWFAPTDGLVISAWPIYPHGQPVIFGG